MSEPRIVPVILSGGSGTRLWPVSRESFPKQFWPLVSKRTLIQETASRARGACFAPPIVICNHEHRFLVGEQLRAVGISDARILLEPVGRNSAPAVAAAALLAAEHDPNTVLWVMAADAAIADTAALHRALDTAVQAARVGRIVAFGVRPTAPETGYGYIKVGAPLNDPPGAYAIAHFVEKPDATTAAQLVADGCNLWNSGMFVFAARTVLEELELHAPDVLSPVRRAVAGRRADLDFIRLEEDAFHGCPSISVDYAIAERTSRAAVVPADLEWSDVGNWGALWELGAKDAVGNVAVGDVVLAMHRDQAQDVKKVVTRLKAAGRSEAVAHNRTYRPWGFYESLIQGDRFQVKRLMVEPGRKLSLQSHFHRAEHWVVVQGTAQVTRDNENLIVRENESVYLPLGCLHRLENRGRIPLTLIEVQSGAYLGEDDIVRLEDTYGRV